MIVHNDAPTIRECVGLTTELINKYGLGTVLKSAEKWCRDNQMTHNATLINRTVSSMDEEKTMDLCEAVAIAHQTGVVVKWTDFRTKKSFRAKYPPESTKLGLQWIDNKGNFDSSVEAKPEYGEGWTVE